MQRRLAAILAADVVGYSRLMGADEIGTLTSLKSHRRELVDSGISEHHGRIVKTTGDGMLVEFASVVDAVGCAVKIQRSMVRRNAAIPAEKQNDRPNPFHPHHPCPHADVQQRSLLCILVIPAIEHFQGQEQQLSALLDFDIATHADLAAANGGDLCLRKKPSLAAFSLSNRRCRIRFQAHRRAQVPVQIIKGGNHE